MKKEIKEDIDQVLLTTIKQLLTETNSGDNDTPLYSKRVEADQLYSGSLPAPPKDSDRSSFVSKDVKSTIDAMMPDLLEPFVNSPEICEFMASSLEEKEFAQQASDYVNHVFQSNDPYNLFNTLIGAGQKYTVGIAKVWYDESYELKIDYFSGLTEDEYQAIELNSEYEVIQVEQYPDTDALERLVYEASIYAEMNPEEPITITSDLAPQRYDVTVKQREPIKKIRIEAVPNDEFGYDTTAVSLKDCRFTYQKSTVTRSDLLKMGYSEEDLEDVIFTANEDYLETEKSNRRLQTFNESTQEQMVTKTTTYWEIYIPFDYDEDGEDELRKICATGREPSHVLFNDYVADTPWALWTPNPQPFQIAGNSTIDDVRDIQYIKTIAISNILDNYYRLANPIMIYNDQLVEKDDITNKLAAKIRARDPNAISYLNPPDLLSNGAQLLQYADTVREDRTHVTSLNTGNDANVLNRTATGMNQLLDRGQVKLKYISRNFAEMCLKVIAKKILKLAVTNIKESQRFNLRSKLIEVDPSNWSVDYDLVINVGLGTNDKVVEQQKALGVINTMAQVIAQQGGVEGPFVNQENIYNILYKYIESTGWKNPDAYLNNPVENPMPPKEPEPDAMMEMAKAEMAKAQVAAQKAEFEAQQKMAEMELKNKELILKQQEMQIKQLQQELDYQNKIRALELQLKKSNDDTELKATSLGIDAAFRAKELEIQANKDLSFNIPDLPGL